MAPSTTSKSELSPASWPLVRGSPCSLAHRPLPSMTIATCRGTRAGGRSGARAPEGCGVGGRGVRFMIGQSPLDVGQRAQPALEVPGEERRHQTAGLTKVTRLGDLDGGP